MQKYLILLLLPFLWSSSCGDDLLNRYDSCCGTDAVTFSLGNGRVFLPNAFTPNGDGINDIFWPQFNSQIIKIEGLRITKPSGKVLYKVSQFSIADPISDGWTGGDYEGLFHYEMTIFDDLGLSLEIKGKGCVIRCGGGSDVFQSKEGCFFPAQGNGSGAADSSLDSFESDCFGG